MGRKKGRRKAPFKLELKQDIVLSLMALVLWLMAGLVVVSFTGQGVVLQQVFLFFQTYFGFGMLLIPFLLILAGLMVSQVKWRVAKASVFIGGLVFFVATVGLFQAGRLGNSLFDNLAMLIHPIGAGFLFIVGLVAGIMIMSEIAIDELLNYVAIFWQKLPKGNPMASVATGLDNREMKIKESSFVTNEDLGEPPAPEIKIPSPKEDDSHKADSGSISTLPAAGVVTSAGNAQLWKQPPLSLLTSTHGQKANRGDLKHNAATIESVLESFGIKAKVAEVNCGPAVTQYALQISRGTKISKITSLQNDLALALAAPTGQIRIEAPIPGRSYVGVEIPNISPESVTLRQVLNSSVMKKQRSKLAVALGLNVAGEVIVADIAAMPHVLIAGSTGSGKSVCLNTFISSILFRAAPDEVKFIMVDPKRVELTGYNDIPHLLSPVIVEPDKVLAALKWAVQEMNQRYKIFAEVGARNIESYNQLSGFQSMPYIVIIIDELADIMLFAPREVEEAITKLAQMARATGMHLVLATQRPSVDVLTGLIKANVPSRIAFNVASMVDSRVILDSPGAEKLLGKGDMLYIPPSQSKPTRIQGTYVSDSEINNLIDYLKNMGIAPQYTEEVTTKFQPKTITGSGGKKLENVDDLFEQAVRIVVEYDRASASLLQRALSIGYARAARMMDQLEEAGVVSPSDGSSKPREVLVKNADEFLAAQ